MSRVGIGVLAIGAALAAAPAACAADRAGAMVAAFASHCLSAAPDFDALNRRASEARYEVYLDRTTPTDDGASVREKNWLAPDPSGTFLLTAEDGSSGGVHATGCGIVVLDAAAADMERALSGDPRLGAPVKREAAAEGGGATVIWQPRLGPVAPSKDAEVMLAYDLPGQPGVVVSLIYRTHTAK